MQAPRFPIAHTVLVAACVNLGGEPETRAAVRRCLAARPEFRVSFLEQLGFTTPERLAFFCASLGRAPACPADRARGPAGGLRYAVAQAQR